MIPVAPQPEPASFDDLVRKPGVAYMARKGITGAPLPAGTKLEPYWRRCLDDLHASYDGLCAYLAVYIERAIGASSTDHFVTKSSLPVLAYEWNNYRLSCVAMNTKKGRFDDVLDPFQMSADVFHIEFVTGRIYPNPVQPASLQQQARETIVRLDLDSGVNRKMRVRHLSDCIAGDCSRDFLRRFSPFVWTEMNWQGL